MSRYPTPLQLDRARRYLQLGSLAAVAGAEGARHHGQIEDSLSGLMMHTMRAWRPGDPALPGARVIERPGGMAGFVWNEVSWAVSVPWALDILARRASEQAAQRPMVCPTCGHPLP